MLTKNASIRTHSFKSSRSEMIDKWELYNDSYELEILKYKSQLETSRHIGAFTEMVSKIEVILGNINWQLKKWKSINENLISYKKFLIYGKLPLNYRRKKMVEEEYLDFEIKTFDEEFKILKDSVKFLQHVSTIPGKKSL